MPRKIPLLLIDDASLLRDGLFALLELEAEVELLGALGGGAEFGNLAPKTAAQVVILEFSMRDRSGPETVAAVKSRWPQARVLVLTFRAEDQIIETALRAGVDGYLLKTDSRSELLTAIRTVAEGKRYISPSIFERVVSGYVRKHAPRRNGSPDGLSDREREVMKRIAMGYRTREIAQQLSLSHKTIEKHRSSLMRKLNLRSAAAVATYATANGYLDA
ncbi:MAG: LuxR family transcriptional regulator [Gammaproteobacteria bacterium]|nr:LuxR family transcriptional regulator [Gammaproteobacteria bacterium]